MHASQTQIPPSRTLPSHELFCRDSRFALQVPFIPLIFPSHLVLESQVGPYFLGIPQRFRQDSTPLTTLTGSLLRNASISSPLTEISPPADPVTISSDKPKNSCAICATPGLKLSVSTLPFAQATGGRELTPHS